jgi:hypothetical protein
VLTLAAVKVIPIPGSSSTKRTLENIAAADVTITPEEKAEIDAILAKVRILFHSLCKFAYTPLRLLDCRCPLRVIGMRIRDMGCFGGRGGLIRAEDRLIGRNFEI